MGSNRRKRGLNTQPGQVVEDRLVEIELAFLTQLQKADGNKGFRDRADLKQLFGVQLPLPLQIAESVRGHSLNALAIRQHQRHPRAVHVAHVLLDIAIELGKHILVPGRLRCSGRVVDHRKAAYSGRQAGLKHVSTS